MASINCIIMFKHYTKHLFRNGQHGITHKPELCTNV